MKLILALIAMLSLTACGTTASLTKADLVYFPSQEIEFSNIDECVETEKRLSKFPKELNRGDNQFYWLDQKTQRAFVIGMMGMGCRYGTTRNTIKIISFYELAETNASKAKSDESKKDFVKKRVDKLGI